MTGYGPSARKHVGLFIVVTLAFILLLPSNSPRATLEDWCAPDAVLIRFDPSVVTFPESVDHGHNEFSLPIEEASFEIPELEQSLLSLGAQRFTTVAPAWRHLTDADKVDRHGNRVELVDFTDVYHVTFDGMAALEHIISALGQTPGIAYVECDRLGEFCFDPDDPLYQDGYQWHLFNTGQIVDGVQCHPFYDINAREAWDLWDSAGTKIGMVDDGITDDHEDLADYIDRTLSRSFVRGDPWWQGGHGTAMAGLAAAGTNNTVGVAGVANLDPTHDDFVLVALKVKGGITPGGVLSRWVQALAYVCSDPVYPQILVLNQSLGVGKFRKECYSYPPTLRDAFRNAFHMDVNLVCSAGQGPRCPDTCAETPCVEPPAVDTCFVYPAAFLDYSFAVAGVRCNGDTLQPTMSGANCIGSYIDLTAPGGRGMATTVGGGGYCGTPSDWCPEGTSPAAPCVSGTIALLLGRHPDLTNEDCYRLLELTASEMEGFMASPVRGGHGLVRADTALAALTYPRFLHHDSLTGWSDTTLISEQWKEFMNVDELGQEPEVWEDFWVHVYEVEASIHKLWPYPDIISVGTVWARGKHSTGWKDLAKYDANFHANYARFVGYYDPEEPDGAIFHTYTHKVFTDPTEEEFLGWHPYDPNEEGFRVHYSVLMEANVDTLGLAGPPTGSIVSFAPVAPVSRSGDATFRLVIGSTGRYSLAIYDVMGRQVRKLLDRAQLQPGSHDIHWDGKDAKGRSTPAGVYIARIWPVEDGIEQRSRAARMLLVK